MSQSPPESRAVLDGDRAQRTIQELIASARRARPSITFDEAAFVGHVAWALDRRQQSEAGAGALHASDLLLAFAACHGDRHALGELHVLVHDVASKAWARFERSAPQFDTARAMDALWTKLATGNEERPPKLLGYHGAGSLAGWLRVTAVRLAYNMLQERGIPVGEQVLMEAVAAHDDVELQAVARRYASTMREAVQRALAALDGSERTFLRLHYVEELTVDEIGVIYGFHRTTAARKVQRAREALGAEIRRVFGELAEVHESDVSTLLRALPDYLDLSVERLLREAESSESRA